MMKLRRRINLEAALLVAIFSLSLILRLSDLDSFVAVDEPKWVERFSNFSEALTQGNLAETYQTSHPGVVTMWIGTISTLCPFKDCLRSCQQLVHSQSEGEKAKSLTPLCQARSLAALLTWVCTVVVYFLVRRLFDTKVALYSAVLISFDPFYLAHSRLLHLDGIVTSLMTVGLLSLLVYLRDVSSRRYLLLAGGVTGLAILEKTSAFFLVPLTLLLLTCFGWNREEFPRGAFLHSGRDLLLWGAVVIVVAVVFWPALWTHPWDTVQEITGQSAYYAQVPHDNINFFMGQIKLGQGPLFYPVALLFRMTPLVLLTSLLSLFQLRKEKERGALSTCWAYILVFVAFTTLVAKKGDRYILPVFPVLDILGAVGLVALSERIINGIAVTNPSSRLHEQALSVAIGGLILLFQVGFLRPHHPYYLSYYNPLLGGPPKAAEILEVGLGEGLERAAQYLNGKENAEKLHVSTWYRAQFAPFFIGQTSDIDSPDIVDSDYFVFYVNQVQRRLEEAILSQYYDQVEPEHIVSVNGIDYAWIYHNVNYLAPLDYLHKHIEPMTDVVLVDRPSLLSKYYRGEAPLYTSSDQMEETELVRYLERISVGHERIWYLSYPLFSDSCREMLNYQLATQAYEVGSVPFPDIEVTLYQLTEAPSFQVASVDSLQPLTFGRQLRLRGYGVSSDMAQWGRSLGVMLEWQVLSDIQKDYKVFLHLVDSQGHIWGQKDRPIWNNSLLPSSQWVEGEVVRDIYTLPLLQPPPLGRLQLVVGLYESESGQRLPIAEEGQLISDSYTLTAIDAVGSPLKFSWESLDIPHVLKKKLMAGVELLGYGVDPESVVPGQDFTVSLYWQALRRIEREYTLLVQLAGEEARIWSEGTFPLATERYPTSHWRPGEVVWGRYMLPVYDKAPWTTAVLRINLLDLNGRSVFEKDVVLGEINIKGKLFSVPNIQHPMQIRLGERIRFLGYALDATKLKAGEEFSLTLYWQTQDYVETSYTVFTHLLDENNHIWGQKDSVPCDGNYPTTRWVTGEVIVDGYEIPVNPRTPPGEYSIEVGMYKPETGERLAVFDEDGKGLEGDRILLGKVGVEE